MFLSHHNPLSHVTKLVILYWHGLIIWVTLTSGLCHGYSQSSWHQLENKGRAGGRCEGGADVGKWFWNTLGPENTVPGTHILTHPQDGFLSSPLRAEAPFDSPNLHPPKALGCWPSPAMADTLQSVCGSTEPVHYSFLWVWLWLISLAAPSAQPQWVDTVAPACRWLRPDHRWMARSNALPQAVDAQTHGLCCHHFCGCRVHALW